MFILFYIGCFYKPDSWTWKKWFGSLKNSGDLIRINWFANVRKKDIIAKQFHIAYNGENLIAYIDIFNIYVVGLRWKHLKIF